jgi:uncharacterized membrane protein
VIQIVFMWFYRFLIFLFTYIVSSRIFSVPVALALHFPHYVVFTMVFVLDMLQVPMFYRIFSKGIPQVWFIRKLFSFLPSQEKVENSKLGKLAQHLGGIGITLITASPSFGGGIWSGVLIAQMLRMDYKKSFFYIGLGSLIGTIVLVYGYQALYHLYEYCLQLTHFS